MKGKVVAAEHRSRGVLTSMGVGLTRTWYSCNMPERGGNGMLRSAPSRSSSALREVSRCGWTRCAFDTRSGADCYFLPPNARIGVHELE